jgi:uncharacterized protein YbcI
MPGFEFRYTLSGAPPTIRSLRIKGVQSIARGDFVNLEHGEVDLGASRDTELLGVTLESKQGAGGGTYIEVVVDGDAVYGVEDGVIRARDDALDLVGVSGAQGVASGSGGDLLVLSDSPAGEPTLVRIAVGRHGTPAVEGAEPSARFNRSVARAVAGISRKHLGHGPKKAEAFFHRNVVVVLMEGLMTPQERSLAAAGALDTVDQVRDAVQRTMRDELVEAIEQLTETKVVGFMSGNQVDPDLASEVFVLERPVRPR